MKTDILQSRVVGRVFLDFRFIPVLLVFFAAWVSQPTKAATVDDRFKTYILDICGAGSAPPGWDTNKVGILCVAISGAVGGSAGAISSSNLGTIGAHGGLAMRQPPGIKDRQEERKNEAEKAASADGGAWGLLLSPQYGNSKRPETELENGFQSELQGLLLGLDYRFSDRFVLGTAVGHTTDDADFLNNAGFLKTTSNTLTLYSTWAPSDSAYVDGYLGAGKMYYTSQRQAAFGPVNGTASGDTSGQQIMAGLSAGSKMEFDRVNFEPFINFDYIKTKIDGYDESGSTLLELRYSDRSSVSTTSSLGGRVSMAFGYDWGTLLPSARLAAVHEYKNDSRQIGNELVIAPGTPFLVETDAPDRNYLLTGVGLVAALNGGAQAFVNYEKRNKDELLNSWAVSIGVLAEF